MSTYTETLSTKLNGLLEKTRDAEKGFKKAAENTEHTYLKKYFERKSNERREFGQELNQEIRSFGEEPDNTGSFAGTAHRAWMDVKAVFSGDNAESMLEEAIRGENAALEEYNDVLKEVSLPYSSQTVLLKQKNAIESDLRTIKRLEDLQ